MNPKNLFTATAVTTMLATVVVPAPVLANVKADEMQNPSGTVDSLHDQVIEETKHRDETKNILENIKDTIDEKTLMAEDAKNKADNKKQVLDELNERLKQDLEREKKKQQEAVDETNERLKQLNKDNERLTEQLQKMQGELNKAQDLLQEKEAALKAAEEAAKEATDEKMMQAKAAVNNARQAFDEAKAEYEKALVQYKQTKEHLKQLENDAANKAKEIKTASEQLKAAKEAQEKARLELETAQANHDKMHAADIDKTLKEELETAANRYKSAEKAVKDQENTVAAAQAVYEKTNNELNNIRLSFEAAEASLKDKQNAYEKLQKDLTTAMQEKDETERLLERTNNEKEQLKLEVEKTRQACAEAKKIADAKQDELLQAKDALTKIENEIEKITLLQNRTDMRGFLEYAGHASSVKMLDDLLKLNNTSGEKWKDIIHLAENGMTLQQMETALDHIDESNAIRRKLQLPEFKVSSLLMLTSWFNTQYCKHVKFEHCGIVHINNANAAENLTTATENMYQGWYYNEKTLYDQYVKSGQFPGLDKMDAYEVQQKYATIYPYIGHYLNLVRPKHVVTGFATSDNFISSQTFWLADNLNDTMTVSEYRAKIEEYKKTRPTTSMIEELNRQYGTTKNEVDRTEKELKELREKENDHKAALDMKNAALREKTDVSHAAAQRLEKLDNEITELTTKVNRANKEATDAENTKEHLKDALNAVTKKTEDALTEWDTAKNILENNKSVRTVYFAEKERLETKLKDIETAKKDVEAALETAKQNKTKKDDMVKASLKAVESRKQEIAKIDAQIQETNKILQDNEMIIRETGKFAEEKELELETAFSVIDQYNDLLDILSKAEEEVYIQNYIVYSLNEKFETANKKNEEKAEEIRLLIQDFDSKQGRRELLNQLEHEFEEIKAGKNVILINSDDAFVKAFQANYPKVWAAIDEYEKALKSYDMLKKDIASDKTAYAAAEKTYLDAEIRLNALLERLNQELTNEAEKGIRTEMKKESSSVNTADINTTAIWTFSFASAACASAVLGKKRKSGQQ